MAAFCCGRNASGRGWFQENGNGMVSSRLQATPKNPPNREEVALREKPWSNHLAAAAKLRRQASPMLLCHVTVFASITLNVTTLALLLYHYVAPPPHC
ncbi:hypothetical protein GUJ93_ZPchr0013g36604 [Zizania palustris]|uniref:Uncharacterized protein n=1 Tax=Zizania palustris TaxID=103762 RepID=A0A8J6BZP9_ZIZPA|nr:hypothetical protein GUJ93_ZPchr0013g36604 [Zizania palustris]